jgi:DNA-binding MarR family transcriptional regulator
MKRIATGTLPAADGARLDLEDFVPFRLAVLANRVTRAVARVYAKRFHLSAPEWRAMAVLGRYGAMTANSVVERTAMDKVRVSRAVARLLVHGRITRRTDPDDRRRAILDLTAEGRAVYAAIVPIVLAVESELLATLTTEERQQLGTILHKLEEGSAEEHSGEEEEDDL